MRNSMMIDGLRFDGPLVIGKDAIPCTSGIALICTEAGEGVKIMSVIQDDDLSKAISESPKMDCWKSHAHLGNIDVYVAAVDMLPEEREKFRLNAISKRSQFMFCDELPKVNDDW